MPTFRASNDSSRDERTYDANFTDAEDPIQVCPEFNTGGLLVCWFKQKFPFLKFSFHLKKLWHLNFLEECDHIKPALPFFEDYETVSTQFDLVCDREYIKSLIISLAFVSETG